MYILEIPLVIYFLLFPAAAIVVWLIYYTRAHTTELRTETKETYEHIKQQIKQLSFWKIRLPTNRNPGRTKTVRVSDEKTLLHLLCEELNKTDVSPPKAKETIEPFIKKHHLKWQPRTFSAENYVKIDSQAKTYVLEKVHQWTVKT